MRRAGLGANELNLWDGRSIRLTLSPSGKEALREYFPGAYSDVVVETTDSMGLWALYGPERIEALTLVLIRWEYIETARQDVLIVVPPEKKTKQFGFRLVK